MTVSSRTLLDVLRATPDGELVEQLALTALAAVEQSAGLRDVLCTALEQLNALRRENANLRSRTHALASENRSLRQSLQSSGRLAG